MAADGLPDLLARFETPEAQRFYDEAVTELDHALQAAALAAADDASPALTAAALLHDVGHLVVGDMSPIDETLDRDHHHELAGAAYLGNWFGPDVTEPVRLHVAAKRYLCTIDRDYHDRLSPSSIRSLVVQGGTMSDDERRMFEREPAAQAAIRVRQWDDGAKVAGLDVPPLVTYLPLLQRVMAAGR